MFYHFTLSFANGCAQGKAELSHFLRLSSVLHAPRRVNTRHGTHCVCKRRRRQQNPAASRRLRIQQWDCSQGGGRVGVAAGAAEEPHFNRRWIVVRSPDGALGQRKGLPKGLPDGGLADGGVRPGRRGGHPAQNQCPRYRQKPIHEKRLTKK